MARVLVKTSVIDTVKTCFLNILSTSYWPYVIVADELKIGKESEELFEKLQYMTNE